MANLLLKNINKIYPNNVQAVFDFNLEIKDKEFIVFVGPSGCGKSTTLRMVAGLEDITFGDLYIDGELVNEVLPKDRDVAMVFQNYALFPHLTVYDNIAFGLKIHKQLHPIIETSPELQEIDDKIALLWKDMKKVNRFFKKHQNDDEKLLERNDLYSQFYLLCDQREKLVKQKVGHYSLGIKLEKKNIARLKSDISGLHKKIAKLEAELKLIADPSVLTALEQEIKDSNKALGDLKKSLEGADPTNVAKIKKSIREEEEKIKDANDRVGQLKHSLTTGPNYIEVYKTAIGKKEGEIKKCEEKIEYLNNNEAPLFKIRKDNKREIELMVNRVADVLDLTRYLYRKPTALSGGQRQRVALGRAIVRNPKVFLMDEPLSNLDAKLRVAMRSEITKIHERVGATTIYVTHDQTEAMTMADRVVCMKAGYVQQIGTPDDLYNNPGNVFVAGFIGSPAMNFIHCMVKKDTVVFKGDPSISIKLNKVQCATLKPFEGQEVILGVRPEDMFTENDATNKTLTNSLKTHCDVSELLGNEIIIYTKIGEDKISMKVDAINHIKEGDDVIMRLNQDKLYFFDAKTEKRIYEVGNLKTDTKPVKKAGIKSTKETLAKSTKKAPSKPVKTKVKKKPTKKK